MEGRKSAFPNTARLQAFMTPVSLFVKFGNPHINTHEKKEGSL